MTGMKKENNWNSLLSSNVYENDGPMMKKQKKIEGFNKKVSCYKKKL